ncbi:hypothetical protein PIB30_070940, partial [Stylosanthes scabra]|nr:hypothetical protein [Stylosanthes scabra]
MANGHLAEFGCIIRYSHGDWILGCSDSVNEPIILRCELLAILHGLTLAWDRGCRYVICETDCLDAFLVINH